jgi:hypothetical protein
MHSLSAEMTSGPYLSPSDSPFGLSAGTSFIVSWNPFSRVLSTSLFLGPQVTAKFAR